MRILLLLTLLLSVLKTTAQHRFYGYVDDKQWHDDVYLSLVEDYRKVDGIYTEQIIGKVKADSSGYFEFTGDLLEPKNKIYKLHVDNCFEDKQTKNHFNSHCNNSKSILFIAKNTDTISFPFSFDSEMFCSITSNNKSASLLINIDNLKEDMAFDFASYRSETNRKLNTKKWFKTLQEYGKNSNDPLAEIYIYKFLTDKSSQFYDYYIEDLTNNTHYDGLLHRLKNTYPNSSYLQQYKTELAADRFIKTKKNPSKPFNWLILISVLLGISLLLNVWFLFTKKKAKNKHIQKAKEQLTKQEQKILDLLLQEKPNKAIAQELFVSLSTVKTHINNIYKKLDVQSRDEAKSLFKK